MASEDIIFQNVGSEVSIDCCSEELVAPIEGVPLPATSTKGLRRSKVTETIKQSRLTDGSGSPLLLSTGDNQASNLAQFITSIRPPPLVNPSASTTSVTGSIGDDDNIMHSSGIEIISSSTVTTSNCYTINSTSGTLIGTNVSSTGKKVSTPNRHLVSKRQPQAIAPAPSQSTQSLATTSTIPASSIITKVIMTPTGQQLLITSPVKQGPGDNSKATAIPISFQAASSSPTSSFSMAKSSSAHSDQVTSAATISTSTSNQPGQQIVFLSPVKSTPGTPTTITKQLVEVRPKPSNRSTGTPSLIQLPVQGLNESFSMGNNKDIKPVQIIRLVSTANLTVGSPSIDTIAGSKIATNTSRPLKPIAPNTSKMQTPVSPMNTSSTTTSAGAKYFVSTPVTPLKCVSTTNNSSSSSSSATFVSTPTPSTPTFLTTGTGGLIMVPAQLLQQQQPQQQATIDQSSGSVLTPISAKYNQIRGPASTNLKQITLSNSKTVTSTPSKTNFVPIAPSPLTNQASALSASQILAGLSAPKPTQNGSKLDNDPNRPRKPCNCTKSQCLKLYCDCFANGEFCNKCNCINCANNLKHEEERQKAIKQCLERNPHAFHPKIGKGRGDIAERRHTKGCNCRRSGCLKNYCECYEAKILCSELCKCISCKNYEDSYERKTLMHLADAAEVRSAQQSVASKSHLCGSDFRVKLPVFINDRTQRLHCAFITTDVIDATCECLLAQSEFGEKQGLSQVEIEKLVIEEFGRCLRQIIESANNSKLAKPNQ